MCNDAGQMQGVFMEQHCFTCVGHPQEDTVQPSMQQHFCEEHAACECSICIDTWFLNL